MICTANTIAATIETRCITIRMNVLIRFDILSDVCDFNDEIGDRFVEENLASDLSVFFLAAVNNWRNNGDTINYAKKHKLRRKKETYQRINFGFVSPSIADRSLIGVKTAQFGNIPVDE